MAIEWTPWFNVPMHRRLEVLCIALFLFSILLGPICTILMLYLLVILSYSLKSLNLSTFFSLFEFAYLFSSNRTLSTPEACTRK